MTLNRSDFFSCAVCGSFCLFKRALAAVAVPSTSLATNVQRAQMQRFGIVVVGSWRMLQFVSAGKRGGRVRTNLAVRDMDLGAHVQLDG